MSLVPDGDGKQLVEFGQVVAPARTIKAELELPLEHEVALTAAFERIRYNEGTGCGVCHRGEVRTTVIPGVEAFESVEYRPVYSDLVELEDLVSQYEACAQADDRCAFLHALFDHGEVRHHPFDEDVPTIFDPW